MSDAPQATQTTSEPINTSEISSSRDAFEQELSSMLTANEPEDALPEAPAAKAEAPKVEEPHRFAHKFSALAKKEAKLLEAQRNLKAQENAIRAQYAQTAKLSSGLEKLGKDPIGALEAMGVDVAALYADLTEQSLTGNVGSRNKAAPSQSEDVMKSVKEEINSFKKEFFTHELDKERQGGIAQARELVESDPDRWTYIQANGVQDEVWHLMELHASEKGVVLEFDEAADMVESYLESEAQKYIEATNRKHSKKSATPAPTQPQHQAPAARTTPNTLSNAMSVKTPPSIDDQWETNVTDPKDRMKYVLRELENMKL